MAFKFIFIWTIQIMCFSLISQFFIYFTYFNISRIFISKSILNIIIICNLFRLYLISIWITQFSLHLHEWSLSKRLYWISLYTLFMSINISWSIISNYLTITSQISTSLWYLLCLIQWSILIHNNRYWFIIIIWTDILLWLLLKSFKHRNESWLPQ